MSRAKGNLAEQRACDFLRERGFLVVEQNFYSRFGEIDIIASKGEVLHFIEVKSGVDYETAVQNLTPRKLSRFLKTCDVYMKKNALSVLYCVDLIAVTSQEIELIENITL